MKLVKVESEGLNKKYTFEENLREGVVKNGIIVTLDDTHTVQHISLHNLSTGIARWDTRGFTGSFVWENEDDLKKSSYLSRHYSSYLLQTDTTTEEIGRKIAASTADELKGQGSELAGRLADLIDTFCLKEQPAAFDPGQIETDDSAGKETERVKKNQWLLWSSIIAFVFLVCAAALYKFLPSEPRVLSLSEKVQAGKIDISKKMTIAPEIPESYVHRKRNLTAILDEDLLVTVDKSFKKRLRAILKAYKKKKKDERPPAMKSLETRREMQQAAGPLSNAARLAWFRQNISLRNNHNLGAVYDLWNELFYTYLYPIHPNYSHLLSYKTIENLERQINTASVFTFIESEIAESGNSKYSTAMLLSVLEIIRSQNDLVSYLNDPYWDDKLVRSKAERYPRYNIVYKVIDRYKKKLKKAGMYTAKKRKTRVNRKIASYYGRLEVAVLKTLEKQAPASEKGLVTFEAAVARWKYGQAHKNSKLMADALKLWRSIKANKHLSLEEKALVRKILYYAANKKMAYKKGNYYVTRINLVLFDWYLLHRKQHIDTIYARYTQAAN